MKLTGKRLLSVLLVLAMVLTWIPAGVLADEALEAEEISVPEEELVPEEAEVYDSDGSTTAVDSGTCGENLAWSFDIETGALTITGTGPMSDFIENGYGWASLIPWDKYRSYITSVSLPDGLTTISHHAFCNCDKIESVTIPGSVTSIDSSAFYNCTQLSQVILPENLKYIGQFAFGLDAFSSIDIPEGTEEISVNAFTSCNNLTTIWIPSNCTIDGAIADCCEKLKAVDVDSDNPYLKSVDGVVFTKDGTVLLEYPTGKTDETYTIPSGVVEIAMDACTENHAIKHVVCPDTLQKFGIRAFSGCTALETIDIHSDIKEFDASSFDRTPWYTTSEYVQVNGTLISYNGSESVITLPSDIKKIGPSCFYGNETLTEITIPDSVTEIGEAAFDGCSALRQVILSKNIDEIKKWTFFGCSSLESITFPEGLTTLGYQAFASCTSLNNIALPESLNTIELGVFNGCSSLSNVTIPTSVTQLGYCAFRDTPWLNNHKEEFVIINGTLLQCNSTSETIVLPCTVKNIAGGAFADCSEVTEIVVPSSVQNAEYGAFGIQAVNLTVRFCCSNSFPFCTDIFTYDGAAIGGWGGFQGLIAATVYYPDDWTMEEGMQYSLNCIKYTLDRDSASSGHSIGEWTTVAPTCEVQGYSEGICSLCGESIIAYTTPALGHDYKAGTVVDPTTTAKGYTVYTCSRCGDSYQSDFTDMLKATGFITIKDKTYYYAKNKVVTGWKTLKVDGKSGKYYFDPDNGGAMATGIVTIKNKKYGFGTDGALLKGLQTIDGEYYDFSSSGVLLTGIQTVKIGKVSYKYYFDPDADGARTAGWVEIPKGKTTCHYYFDPETSAMVVNTLKEIDGRTYYFNKSGVMLTGLQTYNKQKYYFNTDGVMQYGRQQVTSGKKTYTYYFRADGTMLTNDWQGDGSNRYFFNKSGVMLTGLQTVNKQKYYFDPDTGIMQTGKVQIGTGTKAKFYYFNTTADADKDSTRTVGAMYSGWQKLDDGWHYFKSGVMVVSKKLKINKVSYTFDADGVCAAYNG